MLLYKNEPWKKKDSDNCFDVTMGSYDGAELCEFIGIYILSKLCTIVNKDDCGLYRDDGLMIQKYINGQKIDQLRKKIIKVFKEIGFKIDIETNLKIVDFLDITFNLMNGSYRPYKKPNDTLLYINKNSNHPPQIIKELPKIINDRLSRNSSDAEIFHASKVEYETALRNSGYKNVNFQYSLRNNNNNQRNRQRNIIWFNPPFSQTVSTNVAKRFLNLLDKHFPRSNKLHKIFNRNTIKVSYSCTPNVKSIINSHNKKLINNENKVVKNCNCSKKEECPLEGKCRTEDVIYKCIATTTGHPQKAYLGTAEGEFKLRFYNHKKSFKDRHYTNETSLSKYMWEMKDKYNVVPNLKWSIVKTVPGYSNITKKCMLCLHEKYEILNYPKQEELLNKRSELVSKCRHLNKFLLSNYKSND